MAPLFVIRHVVERIEQSPSMLGTGAVQEHKLAH